MCISEGALIKHGRIFLNEFSTKDVKQLMELCFLLFQNRSVLYVYMYIVSF